jgi:hypothetical protein
MVDQCTKTSVLRVLLTSRLSVLVLTSRLLFELLPHTGQIALIPPSQQVFSAAES